jgi:hypothetical protein
MHNDWVETERLRQESLGPNDSLQKGWDVISMVRESEAALENADLLIAEASEGSAFGVGYEVSYALQRKKPTLILVKEKDAASSYATGLTDDLVTQKLYNLQNLESIVADFIKENTFNTKDLRFNFVIDRQLYNHIRWKSFRSKKTKAEVVRELLLKDIEDRS